MSTRGLTTHHIPRLDELCTPGLAALSTANDKSHDEWRGHLAFASKLFSAN
jgi:hypothetical protein